MAKRNETQALSRENVLRVAMTLKDEADVYREEEDAGLTAQQWQAINMIVSGMRHVEIAEELGVRPETLSRWKNDVRYQAALNLAIRENYAAVAGKVRDAASEAVDILRELLDNGDPRVRLSAALSVLRLHGNYGEGVEKLPTTPADVARRELTNRRTDELADLFI